MNGRQRLETSQCPRDSEPARGGWLPVLGALVFGAAGPPLGLFMLILEIGLIGAIFVDLPVTYRIRDTFDFSKLAEVVADDLFLGSLPIVYLFGTIPAAAMGGLAGLLTVKGASPARYLVICTLAGAIISGGAGLVLAGASSLLVAPMPGAACALLLSALFRFVITRSPAPAMAEGARP